MPAYRSNLVVASGGTAIGSEYDFGTSYLKHALAFLGIIDVGIIGAGMLMMDAETRTNEARTSISHNIRHDISFRTERSVGPAL